MKRLTLIGLTFFLTFSAIAQYQEMNGPEGGIIWELFNSSENYYFAITDNSGIYRSIDNLQSWHPTSLLNDRYKMTQTPDGRIYAVNTSGLFVSNDSGVNYERVSGADQLWLPKYIEAINDSVLVILSENPSGRIFRSIDSGEHWETVFDFNSYFYFNCLTLADNGTLFATAKGTHPDQRFARVLRSIDNGATWQELNYGTPVEYQMYCISDSQNNVFLESTDNIYKSIDNGDHWTILTTPFLFTDIMWKNRNDYLHVIDMNGDHYYSSNAGANWTNANFVNPIHNEILSYCSSNDTVIALSKGSGVFQSNNSGQDWVPANNGLTATRITQLAVNNQGIVVAGNINSNTIFGYDSEDQWHSYDLSFKPKRVFCCSDNHFYCSDVADLEHHIYHSTDNAQTWNELVLPEILRQANLMDVQLYNDDLYIAVNSYGGALYKTTDEGLNWEIVNGIDRVKYIDVGPNNEFYVSNERVLCRYREVGVNWDTLYVASEIDSDLHQFAIDPSNGNIVLTDRMLGVKYSSDGGTTWEDRNDLSWLPSSWYWFRSNTLEMDSEGTIYMTAEIDYDFEPWHIFLTVSSSDGGITWENFGEGLPLEHAESFHIGQDGNLYAGTFHGVYKRDLNSWISHDKEKLPKSVNTIFAYPNPFNSSVRISMNNDQSSTVNLRIFDVLGREVYDFENISITNGKRELIWKGKNSVGEILPNGVYFIHLRTDENKTISRKVVLLK